MAWAQDDQKDEGGFIQRQLEAALSGDGRVVKLKGFSGALSSRATIEALTVADQDGVWLTLEDVVMEWRRAALLRGRVEVEELSAKRIALPRMPRAQDNVSLGDTEAKRFALPDLPVSIRIGKLAVKQVDIGEAVVGEAAQFEVSGGMNLSDGEGTVDLKINRTDKEARFIVDGGFSNATRQLKIDLELTEGKGGFVSKMIRLPGNPSIDLSFQGDAPIDDFEAQLILKTDGVERVSGALRLAAVEGDKSGDADAPPQAHRIGINLTGDVTPLVPDDFAPFFGTQSHVVADILSYGGTHLDIETLDIQSAELDLKGKLSLKANGMPAAFDLKGRLGQGAPVRLPISGAAVFVNQATIDAQYDEKDGDSWSLDFQADELVQDAVSLARLNLVGTGQIKPTSPYAVDAALDFSAAGFTHKNPAIARAVGQDIDGVANFAWAEGQKLQVSRLEVNGAGLAATVRGVFGAIADGLPFDGTLRVQADDVARFAELSGRPLAGAVDLRADGHMQFLSQIFDTEITARTQDLQIGIPQIDGLLAGQGQLTINMRRDDLGTLVSPMTVKTDALQAELRGGLNSKTGQGILTAQLVELGNVDPRVSGPGTLKVRADWNKGADIRVHDLELDLDQTTLTGQGRFWPEGDGQPFEGNIRLNSPDLSKLSRLAGRPLRGQVELAMNTKGTLKDKNFDLRGSLTGNNLEAGIPDVDKLLRGNVWMRMDLGREGDVLTVRTFEIDTPEITATASGTHGGGQPLRISARLSDLGLFLADFRGPVTASGELRSDALAPQTTDVALRMTGPGGVNLTVNGAVLQGGQNLDLRLTGVAPMGLVNQYITPKSVSGNANFDLTLKGAPGLDALSGTATANGARLSLPKLQMSVEDITARVTLAQGQAQLDIGGELRSGGRLTVTGPINVLPPNQADLKIKLDGVIIEDPELYRTKVNGKINVAGPLAQGGRISGKLKLPITEIHVPSSGISSLGQIPDINHINEPATVRASRKRAGLLPDEDEKADDESGPVYDLDLVIQATNEIYVRGRGLDAELGGEMHLGGTTHNVVPTGSFELLRGRLDILSKRLELTDGQITLQGDFDAYIRFVAENQADDAVLRIIIEGLVSDPEVNFTSQPDMPEEEVVSRLLFGRGLDQLSPFQAARLAAAVAALAGNGNADLLGNLRDATGLADLDVNTNEEGNTEVTAGFYLSDDIYSEVAVDDQGESEVNIKMDLTKSITVKGVVEPRGNTGIGIFFEKDY